MARKKKEQDLGITGPAIALTVGGSILGLGAGLTVAAGGSAAGLTAAAGFLPITGTAIGGGIVIGQLRKLQTKTRR